ncbi:MAG: rhodanese-like domain-containing protein [Bacteroidia bacterium]|nr:rhodanese-like domain-containing protein [Bacteroidia bacterium]
MDMKNTLENPEKATIIDVRNEWEYGGGNVAGSINIPLHELPARIGEIKNLNGPIILCCASGNRSRQASLYLSQHGIGEVYDGGSWLEVNGMVAGTR